MSRTTVSSSPKNSPKYRPNSEEDTAYEQAQREAARRKKIQEYQNFIKGIKAVTTKFLDSSNVLTNVGAIIMTSVTGNSSTLMKNLIVNVQKEIKDIVNGLNSAGKRAAEEINKEGEPCTFNDAQAKTETTYKEQNKSQFSCDTKALREKVLPELKKSMEKLTDTSKDASNLPKLEGCENISGISGKIDGTKGGIKKIYENVEKLIENTEKAEKENLNIVEKLFNVGGNLFKTSNKEKDSQAPKARTTTATSTRTSTEPTKLTTPTRTPTTPTTPTRTRTTTAINPSELKAMLEIQELAKEYGIPIKGKSQRELLEALAREMDIPLLAENPKNNSRIW